MLLMVTTGRRGCGLNYFIVSHLSPEFSRARLERLAPTEVRIHKGPYDPERSRGKPRTVPFGGAATSVAQRPGLQFGSKDHLKSKVFLCTDHTSSGPKPHRRSNLAKPRLLSLRRLST